MLLSISFLFVSWLGALKCKWKSINLGSKSLRNVAAPPRSRFPAIANGQVFFDHWGFRAGEKLGNVIHTSLDITSWQPMMEPGWSTSFWTCEMRWCWSLCWKTWGDQVHNKLQSKVQQFCHRLCFVRLSGTLKVFEPFALLLTHILSVIAFRMVPSQTIM